MSTQLKDRLKRIYAAIGETIQEDPSEFKTVIQRKHGNTFTASVDFRGDFTNEQLVNLALSAVHNVANLKDHLKRWEKQNIKNSSQVDDAIRQSEALQIIIDMSNYDKHGPPRDDGLSGKGPQLTNIRRNLILKGSTGGDDKPGEVTFKPFDSTPVAFPGSAVVVTGDVVDKASKRLGDLLGYLKDGVSAWEDLMKKLGFTLETNC